MHKYLLAIGVILLLPSCSNLNKEIGLKDDNPLEQAVEEIIKEDTGIVIDFTPEVKNVKVTTEPNKVTITPEKK